jgi:hypothetical protein
MKVNLSTPQYSGLVLKYRLVTHHGVASESIITGGE